MRTKRKQTETSSALSRLKDINAEVGSSRTVLFLWGELLVTKNKLQIKNICIETSRAKRERNPLLEAKLHQLTDQSA
jgi:hypothetical protein